MSNIYCIIDNCHYWGEGNKCHASEIIIVSDSYASETPDNIDAPLHQSIQPVNAADCMDTCCKTFVPRGTNKINVDGVTRN